jgi:hypothetical protein
MIFTLVIPDDIYREIEQMSGNPRRHMEEIIIKYVDERLYQTEKRVKSPEEAYL